MDAGPPRCHLKFICKVDSTDVAGPTCPRAGLKNPFGVQLAILTYASAVTELHAPTQPTQQTEQSFCVYMYIFNKKKHVSEKEHERFSERRTRSAGCEQTQRAEGYYGSHLRRVP